MKHTRIRSRALSTAIRLAIVACLILGATVAPGFAAPPTVPPAASVRSTGVAPIAAAADTTAPVTFCDVAASYEDEAVINLYATDADSGVAHTYFKLDDGGQQEGTAVTVTTGGDHTLEFWSVDVANNVEVHKTAYFVVNVYLPDTTAPTTIWNGKASYVGSALIQLTGMDNDGGSGVDHTYYKLDGGEQVENITVSTSVIGSHTLEYWSIDYDKNEELPHKTATFAVLPNVTTVTIKTSSTSARVGSVPVLSGAITPVGVIGKIMVVYVMKPGSARWTYSSNRVVYALPTGAAAWQYKYKFISGMRKGLYKFKAVFPASAPYVYGQSPNTVSITLR